MYDGNDATAAAAILGAMQPVPQASSRRPVSAESASSSMRRRGFVPVVGMHPLVTHSTELSPHKKPVGGKLGGGGNGGERLTTGLGKGGNGGGLGEGGNGGGFGGGGLGGMLQSAPEKPFVHVQLYTSAGLGGGGCGGLGGGCDGLGGGGGDSGGCGGGRGGLAGMADWLP